MIRRFLMPAALISVFTLCLGFVPGCSDDDDNGTEPEPIKLEDFAGTWTGTKFLVKSQENPQIQFDLIAVGGSISVVMAEDGSYTGEGIVPDPANPGEYLTLPLAGDLSLVDQEHVQMTFVPEYPPMFTNSTFEFTLSGDTVNFTDPNTTFDFDGDEIEDPAIFEGTMVRS